MSSPSVVTQNGQSSQAMCTRVSSVNRIQSCLWPSMATLTYEASPMFHLVGYSELVGGRSLKMLHLHQYGNVVSQRPVPERMRRSISRSVCELPSWKLQQLVRQVPVERVLPDSICWFRRQPASGLLRLDRIEKNIYRRMVLVVFPPCLSS